MLSDLDMGPLIFYGLKSNDRHAVVIWWKLRKELFEVELILILLYYSRFVMARQPNDDKA